MMRKDAERQKARELRERGWSLNAISAELGVAKSSVSLWVRGMRRGLGLSDDERAALGMHRVKLVSLPVWLSGQTKSCGKCRRWLPVELFNRDGDAHQHWCRECFRAYFRERGDKHRRQSAAAKRRRGEPGRSHVRAYLQAHPCVDCGERDREVLEFDHVRDKTSNLSNLVQNCAPLAEIKAEIECCEVVCVNCHRVRTAARGDWLRADPEWRDVLTRRRGSVAQKLLHAYEHLEATGCIDCQETRLVCLDFDHLRDKTGAVSRMVRGSTTLADVVEEIAKCEVRCANCHRRKTVLRRGAEAA